MAEREGYDHELAQEIARLRRMWKRVIAGVVVCLVVAAGFAVWVFWPW